MKLKRNGYVIINEGLLNQVIESLLASVGEIHDGESISSFTVSLIPKKKGFIKLDYVVNKHLEVKVIDHNAKE
jgi:hypothetical protein